MVTMQWSGGFRNAEYHSAACDSGNRLLLWPGQQNEQYEKMLSFSELRCCHGRVPGAQP